MEKDDDRDSGDDDDAIDSKHNRWRSSKLHQKREKVRRKRTREQQEEPFCGWTLFESCTPLFVTPLQSSTRHTFPICVFAPHATLVARVVSPSRSVRSSFMVRSVASEVARTQRMDLVCASPSVPHDSLCFKIHQRGSSFDFSF